MLKTTSSAQQNARMYRNISEYTECAKHARMYRMFIAVYRNIYIYIYEYVGIYKNYKAPQPARPPSPEISEILHKFMKSMEIHFN